MMSDSTGATSPGPVIVTGAAKRVGRGIALRLAELGYPICVHYLNSRAEAQQLVSSIRDVGVAAVTVRADLSNPESAADAIMEACLEIGTPAALINNAAVFQPESIAEVNSDSFLSTMAINLQAPLLLTREFAKSTTEGQVINIVDWRGTRPVPGHLSYTLAKSGLVALTQLLAQELAPRIRVNAVAPGALLPASHGMDEGLELAARNPLRKAGGIAPVVHAVEYLMSAEFVTGEILHVTGGEQLAIQRGHA